MRRADMRQAYGIEEQDSSDRIEVVQEPVDKFRSRSLSSFEKQCMSGHQVYLEMLNNGELEVKDRGPNLIKVSQKSRGPMTAGMRLNREKRVRPSLIEAVQEFEKVGGSMFKFCQATFVKFGYNTCLGMYSSFRLARSGGTRAVSKKPER